MRTPFIHLILFGALLTGCAGNAEEGPEAIENPAAEEAVAPDSAATESAPAVDTATPASSTRAAADVAPSAPAAPATTLLSAGTSLTVALIDGLSTATNSAGDEFTASLAEPIVVDGRTVVEKGVLVRGRVTDSEGSGRVQGRASMQLVLTGIMDGERVVPIETRPFVAEAEATKGRDAAVVGGAAGVGAAIGAIAGGKKGAGIGALIGGASGTGAVLATKGEEVEFGSETRIEFSLAQDVRLPVIRR